ncbi:MAG: helix-turn-helix domain-containing protein [Sandaracinaceae bacterium]
MRRPPLSPFGNHLRAWRRRRGWSQLDLAIRAETTPRYVSFIETGRSRPGRELVLRLAATLDLPLRDRNILLRSAGWPPAYQEYALSDARLEPFRGAVKSILDRHDPYPAVAVGTLGRVVMSNRASRALFPGMEGQSPEELIDGFLGDGPQRNAVENWAEVAWATVDRMQNEATHGGDPRLDALVERALKHLAGTPRPDRQDPSSPVIAMRLRVGDETLSLFTTVLRFENAQELTMEGLRIELMFPMGPDDDALLRALTSLGDDLHGG